MWIYNHFKKATTAWLIQIEHHFFLTSPYGWDILHYKFDFFKKPTTVKVHVQATPVDKLYPKFASINPNK